MLPDDFVDRVIRMAMSHVSKWFRRLCRLIRMTVCHVSGWFPRPCGQIDGGIMPQTSRWFSRLYDQNGRGTMPRVSRWFSRLSEWSRQNASGFEIVLSAVWTEWSMHNVLCSLTVWSECRHMLPRWSPGPWWNDRASCFQTVTFADRQNDDDTVLPCVPTTSSTA